jgi:CDP-diglyceride synthetase
MSASHWHVLSVYFGFTIIATLFALAKLWLRPKAGGGSIWRKYPTYILINLGFLGASWSPPEWHVLNGLLAILGGLASWEIVRALRPLGPVKSRDMEKPIGLYFSFFPYITFSLIAIAGWRDILTWFRVWLNVFLLFVVLNTLVGLPGEYARRALAVAASIIYLPLSLVTYLWIQQADGSGFTAIFLYLTVATNDAMAQIIGELFGAKPLVSHISPSKTIEGALGGILFAGAMGMTLSDTTGWSYLTGTLMGLTVGCAGLLGDLTASVWKRALGLKSFSSLLGAQGGVLDRFDSLILATPVFYLMLVIAF